MVVLEIAGIQFRITGRDCTVVFEHEASYGAFVRDEESAPPGILVNVVAGCFPDISRSKRIFSTGSSWFLCTHNGDFYIVLDPHADDSGPLWIARFNPPAQEVTIFCNEQFAKRKGSNYFIPNPVRYPLDQLILMYVLAQKSGAIIHAAGIGLNNRGYMLPGRSGAGKSTISGLLASAGHEALSDDRVIVRRTDGSFRAFGTPWPGEAGIAMNKDLPLAGIFFLNHSEANRLTEIRPQEVMERLMPVTSIPWYDEKTMSDILSFCEELAFNVPAYELHFKPDSKVVDFLEKFISA